MADSDPPSTSSFPAAFAGAVALLVAALAAIGLSGDSLARAVRIDPEGLRNGIFIALLGALMFVAAQLWPRGRGDSSETQTTVTTSTQKGDAAPDPSTVEVTKTNTKTEVLLPQGQKPVRQWVSLVGIALTVLGVGWVLVTGTVVVESEERPLVSLTSAAPAAAPTGATGAFPGGSTEITVTARAVQMDTQDDLEVQVLGLHDFDQIDPDAIDACEQRLVSTRANPVEVPAGATVLMWVRLGPKADGTVDTTWKLQIPAGAYDAVCGWAARPSTQKDSAAYLSLREPTDD